MATFPTYAAPGYKFDATPDLSRLETRERLSQPAIDGFFAIMGQMEDSSRTSWRTARGNASLDRL
jgi:hypothetical protein